MRKNRENSIHKAVIVNSLDKVRQAIAAREDVEGLDSEGRTPLFYAAMDGAVEIVSELLQHGAACNARDKSMETPLHFAAREYRPDVARMLIEHGAVVDAKDLYGNTPLSHAVLYSHGRGDLIHLLLSSGADRNLENNCGVTPLKLATKIANYDVRKFFD